MDNRFFENPILNSPYAYPSRHWELDGDGQPTQKIVESRRRAEFISPVPKPRKRGGSSKQEMLPFDEGKGLSTREQQYERHAEIINGMRREVDDWRRRPDPGHWRVTPETARLLQHWRQPLVQRPPALLLPSRGGRDGHLADRGPPRRREEPAAPSSSTWRTPAGRRIPGFFGSPSSSPPVPERPP